MSKLFSNLELEIQEQAQKYYTDGSNSVSDAEFDCMIEQLKLSDPNSPMLSVGWGYEVAKDTTYGNRVAHRYGIIGSLDKVHSYEELPGSYKFKQYLNTSLKLDGLSVVLYYENGALVDAVTRGDGRTGISIFDKIPYFNPTYWNCPSKFTGAIRGEILMSQDKFTEFKLHNPDAKNPRNAAAGIINRKNNIEDLKYLDIIVYNVVGCESSDYVFNTIYDVYDFLYRSFGASNVVYQHPAYVPDSYTFTREMTNWKTEWYNNYPADGIVLNIGITWDKDTGNISYDSIAYKYPSEIKTSRVTGITWEMSKNHFAIPIVNIEPIELAGTKVENASGHNAKNIKDNLIGPGALVEITKANEIIPYIQTILTPQLSSGMIEVCPECGNNLIWNGVHLECINSLCPNTIWQDTLQWINTLAPLDNFGDLLRKKYLEKYLDDLSIESVMSGKILQYVNKNTKSKQDKLFYKFIDKLYHSEISLESAIFALNIPRLGEVTCKKLSQFPEEVDRIIECAMNESDIICLLDLNGYIGDANAESIRKNIVKFKRLNIIKDRICNSDKSEPKGSIVITGKLSVKRSEFEKEVTKLGYSVTSTVNKNTVCLITDDPNSTSTKNRQATKLNIPKITEAQFRNRYMK